MQKRVIEWPGARIVLVDTITAVDESDADSYVVAASHGGTSSAEFALAVPLRAVIFNDAGVGKDNAGIAALDVLQARGVACAAVAHTSARIGDVEDMWEHGVIAHVNDAARRIGLTPGDRLSDGLRRGTA
jgi:hypothetical protein